MSFLNSGAAPVVANIVLPKGEKRFAIGGNINISCTVDGYPAPRVSWLKDNTQLEPSERIQISGNFFWIILMTDL